MKIFKTLSVCALFGLSMSAYAQTCPATPAAWDISNAANGGSFAVTSPGAAGTDCKLTVTHGPNNNGIGTVRDDLASAETSYRARFYVDATNIMNNAMGPQHRTKAFVAGNFENQVGTNIDISARPSILQMFIVGLGNNEARLGGFCRDLNSPGNRARFGDPNDVNPGTVTLQPGWNVVEVEIKMGAGTGECRIWVNNDVESSPNWEQTGIDNNLLVGVKRVNIGTVGATQAYANVLGNEELHFDEFESRRQTFIGSN
ncbi:hypothetical protein [Marinicella gelatinilytica]|uniref:hypothetical protein n=1 Tax=Marinicella gelatinilytica TaxID=2996017 RepID=UPI002260B967|nr:hypothetical protein [Marinicella gelatinilytica]MCX7545266.1 hypothetical protein [Marinicella gelatinilytica]